MSSAFQNNAFQNNAFQIVQSTGTMDAFQGDTFQNDLGTPFDAFQTTSGAQPVIVTGPASNDIFLCPVPAFANPSDIRVGDPTKKCTTAVGWVRFKHDPKELERKTRKYGEEERRQRLEELIAEAKQKAKKAESKRYRKALESAVAEARQVQQVDASLLLAMEAVVSLKRVHDQIIAAKHAEAIARARYEYEMEQDEEEALVLLLN